MAEFKQLVSSGLKTIGTAIRRFFLVILALAVVGVGVYFWWANWTYSEGTRAGTLIKISKKGVVFKTYEGQLNLGGFQSDEQSGVVGNIWEFSVTKDEVYEELQNLEGKQVKLHYKQKYKAMPWQGDTDYYIYKAEQVE
jgi:hypothetical protein